MEQYSIHWNGVKTNGDLAKCYYKTNDNQSIHIIARSVRDKLPRALFRVTNDSDHATDYYCTDETIVYPDHPLYRYVKDAARLAEIHQLLAQAKRYRRFAEKSYMTLSDKKSYIRDAEELEGKAGRMKAETGIGTPSLPDFLAAIQYTKRAG